MHTVQCSTAFASLWCDRHVKKTLTWDILSVTPTAGHQFDVSPVDESCLVAGLTANCDLLGLVEGHLAPHPAGFTGLTEADVGLDAQHLWLRYERLPHRRHVAAPAGDQQVEA